MLNNNIVKYDDTCDHDQRFLIKKRCHPLEGEKTAFLNLLITNGLM